jgi:hypothetical protein
VSAFGDVVQALIGSETGLADELDGLSLAPVPSVGSRPGTIARAGAWTAPDASGHGQVTVHRDVLRAVAADMRSDLQDLEGAVSRLAGVRRGEGISVTANPGLVTGWPTAVAFNGNASAAFTGIAAASQQTGTAHQDTSNRLATSAATYDESESDNLRAARSVGTNLYSVAGLVASYGSGVRPAASALGAQPSYPVKTRAVSGFSGAGMPASTIMEILHGLSPGDVAAAGVAHARLGTTLDAVAERLAANAKTLAQNWSGSAAQGAMSQFQQLYDRMVTLAQQALQVGSVLSWLGGEVLPQFTSLPDPRVSAMALVLGDAVTGAALDGLVGGVIGAGTGLLGELDGSAQAAADRVARQYIAKLSDYLVTADHSLPDFIGVAPALAGGRGGGPARPVPVTPVTSGGGHGSGMRLRVVVGRGSAITLTSVGGGGGSITAAGGTTGRAGATGDLGATGPSGGAVPSSSLQGATIPGGQFSPSAGTTSTLSTASPLPGSGGLSGGLPGPVPGVPGATEPPEASGLVTGLVEGEPGASALAGTDQATIAPDMAGFPMMGGGSAAQPEERDRIRQAWLNDDDLWDPPVNLVPPVIDERWAVPRRGAPGSRASEYRW